MHMLSGPRGSAGATERVRPQCYTGAKKHQSCGGRSLGGVRGDAGPLSSVPLVPAAPQRKSLIGLKRFK